LTVSAPENLEENVDIKLVAHIEANEADKVALKSTELSGYSVLRVNAI
jgi:hypothetical protein